MEMLFLTREELHYLTGRKTKSKMIETLNRNGIPFVINANGYPVVRRDYNQQSKRKSATPQGWQPNVTT